MLTGLISILILSVSYAVIGRLALLLAIPPGYATAIFPPAGIAVAAFLIWSNRLWPGVFIGSLILNIWITTEQASLSYSGLVVAFSAASGATLQALAGAWMVSRCIGLPIILVKEKAIFKFMLVAGPVACIINPSFGVTSLYATGIITLSDYGYSWFTWWVGDTIGVLITAPLMFIFFAKPKQLWWGRRFVVALPLFLMLSSVVFLFVWVSKWELERTQFYFKEITTAVHEKLRTTFTSYLDAVASVERFLSSSSHVSRNEFRSFVDYTLKNKPGINGLSWNPIIIQAKRDKFEKTVFEEGFPNFYITERDAEGTLVKAGNRSEYFPVYYIEPINSNMKAFGFDVASNVERRKALFQSRDNANAVATERITLVQEKGNQAGFLLFHPVYQGSSNTIEERRRNLKGFAVGVFRVGDIVDSVLDNNYRNKIILSIQDKTSGKNSHLYGSEDMSQYTNALYKYRDTLDIGGRRWNVSFWPTRNYLDSNHGWQAWTVLAGGLLFTSILGTFLLAMTGRSYQVENLVERRTAELSGILSTAIEAIIILDDRGMVESINPAGVALFGYASAELFGQPVTKIIPDFFSASTTQMPPNKLPTVIAGRHDSLAYRKDATSVSIELAISTLSVFDRTLYTAIVHDLTERKKVDRMKNEFVSTVSHELRTPLTSIKGALGLILGGVLDSEPGKMRSILEVCFQNSERLEFLISDLLEINKIQFLDNQVKMQPLSVNALISKSVISNQGYADNYGVSFLWHPIEEDDVYINANENKLMQVLANLFSNAVKYSPKGAPVVISTSIINNDIRVSIADSGPGIPIEFHDQVFDMFTQADSSDTRRVGGTGLGLAITKSIIENHGGCIGFESKVGHGSTFYFDLPTITSTHSA